MSEQMVTVMLVDDDELEFIWLQRQTKALSIECNLVHASDGEQALEQLLAHQIPSPNIIFLDINMPRMDGHEFLVKLREDPIYKSSVVFMLSSSEALVDKQKAYDKNVAGYILKSCNSEKNVGLGALLKCYCENVQLPII